MATNPFFNNYNSLNEQTLYENLSIEAIAAKGIEVYYLNRTVIYRDDILNEPEYSNYAVAFPIEMYLENIQGFSGDMKFLSKFGIENRDEITFTVAMRRFHNEASSNNLQISRPQEGDIIYFPLTFNKKLYIIKFVDQESVFYQFGTLKLYKLTCEQFEFSNETFTTGIAEIDNLVAPYTNSANIYNLLNAEGILSILTTDSKSLLRVEYSVDKIVPLAMNDVFAQEASTLITSEELNTIGHIANSSPATFGNFTSSNPFGTDFDGDSDNSEAPK